tara:strand:+ start:16980 stop:18707 length:1728 start_codon:yes stop_codon:yes gene_type:complete
LFSCSKDADLLSEYVIAKNDDLQSITLLADDSFFMAPGQNSILMDVLNNDNISQNTNVTIVETSTPINGSVTINTNNTLTYIPKTAISSEITAEETTAAEESATSENSTTVPEEDTFTYTAEVVDQETGETTKEEATVTVTPTDMGELKAFPGAEGFGKNTTGGRGGIVYHVTNLNDNGPGSLRDAVERQGTRTVIFDVGGEISLLSNIVIRDGDQNLTIAGESAPSPGISLRNYGIQIQTGNIIIRYLTIRLGDYHLSQGISETDCLRVVNFGDGLIDGLIFDHLSLSWSTDESLDINSVGTSNSDNYKIQNVTVSNTIIGEPTGVSGYNMLYSNNVFNMSIYNNYMCLAKERSPLNGYGARGESSEVINNIIYGFKSGSIHTYGTNTDVIGNIYKGLPSNDPDFEVIGAGANGQSNTINDGSLYARNNYKINASNKSLYNEDAQTRIANTSNRFFTNSTITNPATTISSIESQVLTSTLGNSLYRDAVDTRLIDYYLNSTGSFWTGTDPSTLPGGWPSKPKTSRPTNYDTDNDGMADDWERSIFGDLSKTAMNDENGNGYTNIEEFLYSITLK